MHFARELKEKNRTGLGIPVVKTLVEGMNDSKIFILQLREIKLEAIFLAHFFVKK